MAYRIKATDTAKREIRELPGHVRQIIRRLVDALAENPTPPTAQELRGLPGRYRIRQLAWRVIYRVDTDAETVLILTIRRKSGPETYEEIER
jgi:mRNA-degrading endonuclease RelE of RelBE toxin-antitoxin system